VERGATYHYNVHQGVTIAVHINIIQDDKQVLVVESLTRTSDWLSLVLPTVHLLVPIFPATA